MKISTQPLSAGVLAGLLAVAGLTLAVERNNSQPKQIITVLEPGVAPVCEPACAVAKSVRQLDSSAGAAPFILQDTDNDSPGSNFVTRIVTITAAIGGTPPLALQWKINRGSGFEPIADATNAIYRIGNAQPEHNGYYALFATNLVGHIHTTPVRLIVLPEEID
jgi:hypothetical protein